MEAVTNLGIYCALAAIAGAKLMMFLVDMPTTPSIPARSSPSIRSRRAECFMAGWSPRWGWRGGTCARPACRCCRTADVFAPAIALGHGIGRLGCFAAGCCWGVACDRPWAVTFTNPAANHLVGVPLGIPLHPTQLYEAFAEFAIFGLLYRRFAKPHPAGAIIALYLMLYSAARFTVEFFRYHEQGNLWGGPLDTSQWISLALFALGAAYFTRRTFRRGGAEAPPTSTRRR